MSIAREPVQLGNNELGAIDPAGLIASASFGLSVFLPLSISTNSFTMAQLPPFRYSATALRCASMPSPDLPPIGRNTQVADPFPVCHGSALNLIGSDIKGILGASLPRTAPYLQRTSPRKIQTLTVL